MAMASQWEAASDDEVVQMAMFLARRAVMTAFVLWGVLTVIFVVVRIVPGDPALTQLGPTASEAELEAFRERFGLNQPLLTQYLDFMARAAVYDFGSSFRLGGPAMAHVLDRLPMSLLLAGVAMLVALLVSFPLGVRAALRPGGWADRIASVASLTIQGLPTFWVGIMLILVFARVFRLLPSGGGGDWQHVILPAVTLSLPLIGVIVRLVRSGLLEVMREGYIQTARSKGLADRIVVGAHGLRNVLIPVVTVLGLQFGVLIGGSVVVEMVFSWPGIGRLLIEAIGNRDYPVVQASVAVMAMIFVALNLIVDLLYGVLDPRIRQGAAR